MFEKAIKILGGDIQYRIIDTLALARVTWFSELNSNIRTTAVAVKCQGFPEDSHKKEVISNEQMINGFRDIVNHLLSGHSLA